ADSEKLLASEVNTCVPLFVSQEILMSMLDLVAAGDVRVMIVPDARGQAIQPMEAETAHSSRIMDESRPDRGEFDSLPTAATKDADRASPSDREVSNADARRVDRLRNVPELSEREVQVLNGLVKGHANKVIARTCDIAEATVKVHIRSILRKIRVGNRTQAA